MCNAHQTLQVETIGDPHPRNELVTDCSHANKNKTEIIDDPYSPDRLRARIIERTRSWLAMRIFVFVVLIIVVAFVTSLIMKTWGPIAVAWAATGPIVGAVVDHYFFRTDTTR